MRGQQPQLQGNSRSFLSAPSTMRTHRAFNLAPPKPKPELPSISRRRRRSNTVKHSSPSHHSTESQSTPYQHNTTTPHKHTFALHIRRNGTYGPQDPAAAVPSVLPQDCERPSQTQNRPRLSTTTPQPPPLSRSFFSAVLQSPPVAHPQTTSFQSHQTRSAKYIQTRRPLTSHVRPTGAKHKLQGGLLPLRQARQRPRRTRRPGRPPQSMRPEPYSCRDQGPREPDGRRL